MLFVSDGFSVSLALAAVAVTHAWVDLTAFAEGSGGSSQ
jgi:hypothetical protein